MRVFGVSDIAVKLFCWYECLKLANDQPTMTGIKRAPSHFQGGFANPGARTKNSSSAGFVAIDDLLFDFPPNPGPNGFSPAISSL